MSAFEDCFHEEEFVIESLVPSFLEERLEHLYNILVGIHLNQFSHGNWNSSAFQNERFEINNCFEIRMNALKSE